MKITWLESLFTTFVETFTLELSSKFSAIVVSGELITSLNFKNFSVNLQSLADRQIFSFDKIFSISLSRLIQSEMPWKLLSFYSDWEWVFSWVGKSNFSNFKSVISQKVMNDVCSSFKFSIEFKYFSIIFKKLFFRINLAST